MLSIFRDLFINLAIIMASITFGNLIIREKLPVITNKVKVLISIFYGILGCVLMVFSVKVAPTIIVDFRCIPIIIIGVYSSFFPTMITASIIGLFRIVFMGFSQSSIVGFVIAIFMGVACGIINRTKLETKAKFLLSFIAVCLLSGSGFVYLIRDPQLLTNVLLAFYIGLLAVSTLTYIIISYILLSNERYIQLKNASNIDFLTGVHNVRHFDNSINSYLTEADEKRKSISLLFLDIDFFKKVNDTYGHINGDLVLKQIADLLMKFSREVDIVTRNGGEEFTILLLGCGLSEAGVVAERIRKAVEQHDFIINNGGKIHITVSIGVSSYPETSLEQSQLIEQADIALYKAKRAGRNAVSITGKII